LEAITKFDKNYILLLLLIFTISLGAQDCRERVSLVYENIIQSIGNNSIFPPELYFSNQESSVAEMTSDGITIEQKVIDMFCNDINFEDKISYVLAHELAHHYLQHSWMSNTGLSYASSIGEFIEDSSPTYSRNQRKLAESQADLYAGFYGQISGYKTLENASETLRAIYEEYSLPKETSGYPSFDERIDIIKSKINEANDLAFLFEVGNVLLLNKDYKYAMHCFEKILKKFNSREIYNNLGLTYLLHGISIHDSKINSLLYPVSIDFTTRAEISLTRGNLTDDPIEMINQSSKLFTLSLALDPTYLPAQKNDIIAKFILKSDYKKRKEYVNNIQNLDSEFLADLQVINSIICGKKVNKKIASKGSYISKLNTSDIEIKEEADKDLMLEKIGLSVMDIYMNDGRKILDSKFKTAIIGEIQIVQNKDICIFKIPSNLAEEKQFNEDLLNSFIKTEKGYYFVYDLK
jgi:tetratricopeptide (TPR) repeat protein